MSMCLECFCSDVFLSTVQTWLLHWNNFQLSFHQIRMFIACILRHVMLFIGASFGMSLQLLVGHLNLEA